MIAQRKVPVTHIGLSARFARESDNTRFARESDNTRFARESDT
jgi:hypothetical protein